MNQTLSTPHPDNIMTNDINNPTPRNNAWKYEAKISALKSYVQCELSTLHNKIDRFMETFNKTISTFETKPYEILQDNIDFLQNELRSKDEIIKTLMETQTAVLENLHLSKPPQQTESCLSSNKLKEVKTFFEKTYNDMFFYLESRNKTSTLVLKCYVQRFIQTKFLGR